MLKPHTYIAFDFEATGLDTSRDEPIQIGLVKFDENFSVIGTYESLIKPTRPIKELRDIVTYLTGFNLDDLATAPSREQVIEEIAPRFDDDTVVIGHNIGFDVALLQNYLDFTPLLEVDTYIRSKVFFHFLPSYALEVIAQHIKKVNPDSPLHQRDDHHDALHDSLISMEVWKAAISKLTKLRRHYMIIDMMIQQSTGDISQLIQRTHKSYTYSDKELFLPPLKKEIKQRKKSSTSTDMHLGSPRSPQLYCGNLSLRYLLTHLPTTGRQTVLAFSHRSKTQLAATILDQLGQSHTSLHQQVIIDQDRVNHLLQKEHFSDEEIFFVSKYFSQYDSGYAHLDLNSAADHKIFSALTKQKPPSTYSLILTTHQQLWQHQAVIDDSALVMFFDHDRRYQSVKKRYRKPTDLLRLLESIDQLTYRYELIGETEVTDRLANFNQRLTIFVGVMSSEIDDLYRNFSQRRMEVDSLIDHPRLPHTTDMFHQLSTVIDQLPSLAGTTTDHDFLTAELTQLTERLTQGCQIEKRMYGGDKRYYLLHQPPRYVDYAEFEALCHQGDYRYLSTSKRELSPVASEHLDAPLRLHYGTQIEKIAAKLADIRGHQFIISSSKHASQQLFSYCVQHGLHQHHALLAENISGGVGKNVFLAMQSEKPVVMIGGYNFYMQLLAKKVAISDLHLYHIQGPLSKQIIADLLFYAG